MNQVFLLKCLSVVPYIFLLQLVSFVWGMFTYCDPFYIDYYRGFYTQIKLIYNVLHCKQLNYV